MWDPSELNRLMIRLDTGPVYDAIQNKDEMTLEDVFKPLENDIEISGLLLYGDQSRQEEACEEILSRLSLKYRTFQFTFENEKIKLVWHDET